MHTDRKDIRFAVAKEKKKLTAVGFEPTRIAPPELESGALDRSAKLSSGNGDRRSLGI